MQKQTSQGIDNSEACGPDCPCQEKRRCVHDTNELEYEWKPCLLVRSIQACYSNTANACGMLRQFVKDPNTTLQEIPARTWCLLHRFIMSPQGECIRRNFNYAVGTAGKLADKVLPSAPPVLLEEDLFLHVLASLYGVPTRFFRRLCGVITTTSNTLDAKYMKTCKK